MQLSGYVLADRSLTVLQPWLMMTILSVNMAGHQTGSEHSQFKDKGCSKEVIYSQQTRGEAKARLLVSVISFLSVNEVCFTMS